jgi:hypothetical protein
VDGPIGFLGEQDMSDVTINVARDFSRYPSGRYRSDSRSSGEQFRDDLLVPPLQNGARVIVELDGTLGYGSSFLDEAFGGLRRERQFSSSFLASSLVLITRNPILKAEIQGYLA